MAREYIPAELRRLVVDRSGGNCEYCKFPMRFSLDAMEIDHILPVSRGGMTVAENLAFACHGCNQYKQNRCEGIDPVSAIAVPLYNPREMVWEEHFAWSLDTTLIVGKTPTGRVTVSLLKLNRSGAVNLRRVLRASREHPPN
jgi:hypothetical protein